MVAATHPLMATNCEALACYWLSIAYAFDQTVAYDGVLVLACAYTRPLQEDAGLQITHQVCNPSQ